MSFRYLNNRKSQYPIDYPSNERYQNDFITNFDGVDAYCVIPSFNITNNITVAAWTKINTAGTGMITKWDTANNRSWWFGQSSGLIRALVSEDGLAATKYKDYTSSIGAYSAGKTVWSFVAFTFASNVLKIYINGVEDTSVTKTVDNTVNTLHSSTTNILFGAAFSAGTPTGFTNGFIDEITIWDKAFSAAEMLELYNSRLFLDARRHSASANLFSYWRMGDYDTYPTLNDVGKNSNNAAMTNMIAGDIARDER